MNTITAALIVIAAFTIFGAALFLSRIPRADPWAFFACLAMLSLLASQHCLNRRSNDHPTRPDRR